MIRWILVQFLLVAIKMGKQAGIERDTKLYQIIFDEVQIAINCWLSKADVLLLQNTCDTMFYDLEAQSSQYKTLILHYTVLTVDSALFKYICLKKDFPKEFNVKLV